MQAVYWMHSSCGPCECEAQVAMLIVFRFY